MDLMKIEWVNDSDIYQDIAGPPLYGNDVSAPVVRLAAVDEVIGEAVWAMYELAVERRSSLADLFDIDTDSAEFNEKLAHDKSYQRAKAFLARPDVQAWRARQKG